MSLGPQGTQQLNKMAVSFRCPKCGGPHRLHPRPRADQRGYTRARWRKLRDAFLRDNPLCSGRYSLCQAAGRVTAATDMDHDTPVTGPNDPTFFTGPFNALCGDCHRAKTQREKTGG